MRKHPLLVLLTLAALVVLNGCSTPSHDLPEKYAGVIGKQYRTRSDGFIWKESAHQYEFTPYRLSADEGYKSTRLEPIPAGTLITIKAAKRSYVGGDWDYLIGEVRAPSSGNIYEFETLLGFSTYYPGDVAKLWDPVDKSGTPAPLLPKGDFFHAPNARFSLDRAALPRPESSYTVTESQNPGSISFTLPGKGIVRIDYCTAPQQILPEWAAKSTAGNGPDRTLDGVVAFVGAKTPGLKEITLLAKQDSKELGGDKSAAVYRLNYDRGEYAGISYRGFLVFSHGADTFVLHYQTGESFSTEQAAAESVLAHLLKLRDAMIFHAG